MKESSIYEVLSWRYAKSVSGAQENALNHISNDLGIGNYSAFSKDE